MMKLVLLLVFVCFQFSKSEELSAFNQVKDVGAEVRLNEANDADYDTYDSDEEPTGENTFNSDWLRNKLSEELSNEKESKLQSILDKLTAIAEMIADYSDEDDSSLDWDDSDEDASYWNIIHEMIANARYRKLQRNKNGKTHENTEVPSVVSPPSLSDDEARHPVKRFTSV